MSGPFVPGIFARLSGCSRSRVARRGRGGWGRGPIGPGVDDVGFDAEAGGDVGDAEFGVVSGLGSMSRCWWTEPRARSRQAASTSGGKGMHRRLAGPRRAGRIPALIQ